MWSAGGLTPSLSPYWHGFAMQDARALPSKRFRRRYAAWRVTLERPLSLANNTKSLLPDKPPASRVPSSRPTGRTERRRRHFGLRHPWLRPKPASNILVLAPNRGRAVLALIRFGPYVGCGCAIIPDGVPDPLNSTRRFAGGTNTVPARGFSVHVDYLFAERGEQCKRGNIECKSVWEIEIKTAAQGCGFLFVVCRNLGILRSDLLSPCGRGLG